MEGVSQKMLTQTLRSLESDSFLTRTTHPTIPPRAEYDLTDLGRSPGAHIRAPAMDRSPYRRNRIHHRGQLLITRYDHDRYRPDHTLLRVVRCMAADNQQRRCRAAILRSRVPDETPVWHRTPPDSVADRDVIRTVVVSPSGVVRASVPPPVTSS
ncbi:winged helix-turn-helix transcriptional regulator [Nocardia noduli]|uniref:winged helix-turn-helix transcriptional regulator n=1 Tax=Nocardia noduli TaxID=2815722 RepID=UPI001C24F1FC|nr:helix-turn-helix domain-containing protein [Nocardia noduli]